jgi:hypothetical protein
MIRHWWEQWPSANIGGALGPKAGRFAEDVDPRNGGDEAQAALLDKNGALPTTLTAGTGGDGYHFVFRWPAGYTGKLRGKLGPGLDVKAEGGYIVLAPSLHASGKRYHWLNEAPIADAPAWMLDKLREPKAVAPSGAVGETIADGERNSTLASLAGSMRRRGMGADEIEAALRVTNEQRCSPPLDADEVRKIVESISRYAPEPEPDPGPTFDCAPEEPPGWWDFEPQGEPSASNGAPNWSDSRVPANAATAEKISTEIALSRIVTAQTILTTHYPEPKWAVKGLIPEGVTFIAGPPKLGKSIFALNLAVAVAEGGKALSHFDVERGAVLYLALEDGPRRIQERLLKLTKGQLSDKLQVVTEWPRLNQGGLEAIEAWIERHKDDARLLIVDTLKMLRPLATGRDRNAYDADYEAIQPLTRVASQRVALCVVHHTRKAIAEDPLATVSGSYGLTGAADGVLVLSRRRNRSDATLSVIGRDVEEQELALEFKPDLCLWSTLGKSDEVRRSNERQEVLDLLAETGEMMAPKVIADLLDKQQTSTRTLLYKMRQAGEIKAFGTRYQLPDFEPPAKSVPSVPKAKSTGNAPKAQKTESLPQNVPTVPTVPSNSQERTQTAETENSDKVGTLGTFHDKANGANGLGPFPAKNVPGNAGNGRALNDALREMNDPTHRRRVVL